MPNKSYSHVITWNNYPANWKEIIASLSPKYFVGGQEIAPTTGTPHIQGYISFPNQRSSNAIRKLLSNSFVQPAKGSPQSNYDYCTKEESEIYEIGNKPSGQGSRTDIVEIVNKIEQGASAKDIILSGIQPTHLKMVDTLFKYVEKARNWKPHVKWYYGETGSGKSKAAFEELPDAYVAMSTAKWWEGYDAHPNVIIDDMRGDFCKFHELLRILDRYAHRIETKGGSRQFLAKNIIITSCHHPCDMYETREDVNQLIRRIDEIKKFTNKKKISDYSIKTDALQILSPSDSASYQEKSKDWTPLSGQDTP